MIPLSIRGKFALWACVLAGVVVIVFAGGTLLNLYHEQLEAVDIEVDIHRRQLAGLQPAELRSKSPRELVGLEPLLRIAVFDSHGQVLHRSADLSETIMRGLAAGAAPQTVRDSAGASWRVSAFRLDDHAVALAYQLKEVLEVVDSLLISYALSLPVVLVVAALGGWWVAGRALEPLRGLTAAAESIKVDALDRRVPVTSPEDEIQRLATVLNAMLARVERGYRQAQRFAADASHELRTPLTIMHGEIERLLRTPELPSATEGKLLSLQEEIARLDRITQQLLLLARLDSGDFPLARSPFDFSDMVRAACEDAELLAAGKEITVTTEIAAGVILSGDAANLRRVVLTLLDNATRYNEPKGQVRCILTAQASEKVELRVGNTGPGIPPDSRRQLFQRFFRADPARQRGGHGLGLSLAQEIVRAHGGQVYCNAEAATGWTEFVVILPSGSEGRTSSLRDSNSVPP